MYIYHIYCSLFDELLKKKKIENVSYLRSIEFEKDDDTNHHVDYLYAATNIRSKSYKIRISERDSVCDVCVRVCVNINIIIFTSPFSLRVGKTGCWAYHPSHIHHHRICFWDELDGSLCCVS
jgi:hypothetical protein